ncbi:MAG TPA: Fur family transcriptional regulator [Candidatus Saccharimonadales bacterium]|nr:Fur family transcriptional regulator [Candidatus Saccharimonadales bacterium]
MSSNVTLAQHLKRHNQNLTKPRRVVFAAFQGAEPQTMQQLVAACPTIDRASVYRTVALFEKLGIIQRLQIGWKYKLELTDSFSRHHHHMTCQQCGRIITFDESPELERQLRWLAASHRFKIRGHQLEIQGLCPTCRV